MAITSIMNATPAAAKAFIDNLGFAGITTAVSSSGTNVSYIKHNNELVLGGLKVYYNDGGSSFDLGSSSSEIHYTILACTNGIIIQFLTSDGTTKINSAFMSFNSDGTLIYGAPYKSDSLANPRVCRSDLENYLANNCTRHLANCTTLANFVTAASLGDANVAAENAYYIPIYQYDGMGIITLNNEKYITNGYWCIKD